MIEWMCHAIPAATGVRCGHVNKTGGILWRRVVVCCEACGCTKKASDDRARRAS